MFENNFVFSVVKIVLKYRLTRLSTFPDIPCRVLCARKLAKCWWKHEERETRKANDWRLRVWGSDVKKRKIRPIIAYCIPRRSQKRVIVFFHTQFTNSLANTSSRYSKFNLFQIPYTEHPESTKVTHRIFSFRRSGYLLLLPSISGIEGAHKQPSLCRIEEIPTNHRATLYMHTETYIHIHATHHQKVAWSYTFRHKKLWSSK